MNGTRENCIDMYKTKEAGEEAHAAAAERLSGADEDERTEAQGREGEASTE